MNANTNNVKFPSPSATVEASPIPDSIDWEVAIKNEERKLRLSKIVFNPPNEMLEQRTETIQAQRTTSFTPLTIPITSSP